MNGVGVETIGPHPQAQSLRESRRGDVIMARARYDGYVGAYPALPFLGVYLCLEGGGQLVRRNASQNLEGAFLPGRVGLGAVGVGGEGHGPRMDLLALGIAPARLSALVAELPGQRLDLEAAASAFHDDPLLAASLRAMWQEGGEHGLSSAFVDHALAVVLHRIAAGVRSVPPGARHRLTGRQMERLTGFIEASGADLSVAQLAAVLDLSPNHFSRCFRATTGLPPYAFLTRRRLDEAARLLTGTSLSITEIAALSGYANPSQFASAFRRHTGASPSAWRREG
ncbi:helix-turn-helix transcriptional regulator [Methylobacterium oxalidis]|uniref:helix-turn-helix transcriptional regulator n=1 Tax=Methylobacterium oxalidis TaxID=944322 RepID=UPI001478D363|nr:helix-turn-helix transcriptional regulator [Methylobacterium oxalidis]GJE33211.1 HTH-type transcriptional activator RhaR [Methylobacterium oxalidis]